MYIIYLQHWYDQYTLIQSANRFWTLAINVEKIRRNNAIKLPFLCIIFEEVYDKLQWSCPMMIGSHQSKLQFPRVVITWNHLYHTSLAKPNFARKCLKFHLFPVAVQYSCTLTFCPLASSDLVLQVFFLPKFYTYILRNINILFAIAKGCLHRCCYGQYLSILFPISSSHLFGQPTM